MSNYQIREVVETDIDQLIKIEECCFSTPWTREMIETDLQNPYAHYLVIEDGSTAIGYCGSWAVFEDAQITNIAILPEYRGKKLGERLLREMMSYLHVKGVQQLSLEVRLSNQVAQGLYRKLGFQNGGIRKGYYQDNHEDAQVMWVKINE